MCGALDPAPRRAGYLPAEDGHRVYFEQWGEPGALPLVYLHGGPGSGCGVAARALFDPARFTAVFLDQRGAGRSKPAARLQGNTTAALVHDLERLRSTLGIDRWLLFGGSWGAALALRYAQEHPRRVLGMVLRGVFLARRGDARWFFGTEGVARLFPREYEEFVAGLDAAQRAAPTAAFARRLASPDPEVRLQAARRWHAWEARVLCHALQLPGRQGTANACAPPAATRVQRALIAAHYARHEFFLQGEGVLTRPQRLRGIPGHVVHGALDLVCPLENAWTLHRAWPEGRLQVLENCGHSAMDPRMRGALVAALDAVAARCSRPV